MFHHLKKAPLLFVRATLSKKLLFSNYSSEAQQRALLGYTKRASKLTGYHWCISKEEKHRIVFFSIGFWKKEGARVAPGFSWHSYLYPIGKQSDEVAMVVVPFAVADALLFSVVLIVQMVAVAFLTSINPPGDTSVVWLVVVVCSW
jgi:hypothetical protein